MTARTDIRASFGAFLFYAAFYAAVFARSLLTGRYIAPSDALDFGVAAYLSSPSFWTEGLYSGYPIAADPQSLIWYPVLQICRLLGLGWNTFMIAAFVLASTTMFALVRRLTWSTNASLVAGLAFGFGGPMLGNIGHFNQLHAVAWMPLVVLGLQHIREGRYRGGAALAAAAFALMWLAGHPQIAIYTAYLSAAVVISSVVIDRPEEAVIWRRLRWSGAALALGAGLAAVMIVPMAELSSMGGRAEASWELYTTKSLPPWQLLTLVMPAVFGFWADHGQTVAYLGEGTPGENLAYVGIAPLVLAAAAAWGSRFYRVEARLWFGIAVLAAFLALGGATPVGTLFFYLPTLARFRMATRYLFLVALALSVGAGYAIAELERRREMVKAIAAAGVAVLLAAGLGLTAFAVTTPVVPTLLTDHPFYASMAIRWPLGMAAGLVAIALASGRGLDSSTRLGAFGFALIVLQAGDLFGIHYRVPGYQFQYADIALTDVVPQPRIAALRDELRRTGERVLAVDGTHNRYLLPNLTRPWDINAASGAGPLGIGHYTDLMRMGGPGDVSYEILEDAHQELDLFGIRYVLVPTASDLAGSLRRQPVRWTETDTLSVEDDPDSHYTLFRNGRARPRAWCAGGLVEAGTDDIRSAIRTSRLADGRPFDAAAVALAEPGALPAWANRSTPDAAADVQVQLGRERRYVVNSRAPCLLVLSEPYYPWWRASIDGEPATVAEVNYAMTGVIVPPGSHLVRLSLRPTSVWIGAGVTALSLLAWCGLALGARREQGALP